MNRAQRRRAILITGGPKAEARQFHHAPDLKTPPAGEHMWITVAMFRTRNPEAEQFHLDLENLLTIEGPACYICEQHYTKELATRPCAGEPS